MAVIIANIINFHLFFSSENIFILKLYIKKEVSQENIAQNDNNSACWYIVVFASDDVK
jgi:hypothetical protein